MKIWAASRISAVIDHSHQILAEQRSAAHVARFVEPRVGPAASPDCPSQTSRRRPLVAVIAVFCSQITATSNCQIRKTSTAPVVTCSESRPSAGMVLSKPICHLFHLFYQAQIRLGSAAAIASRTKSVQHKKLLDTKTDWQIVKIINKLPEGRSQ